MIFLSEREQFLTMSKRPRGAWQTKLVPELAASEQVTERDKIRLRIKHVKFPLAHGPLRPLIGRAVR